MVTRDNILNYIKTLDGAVYDKPFSGDFDSIVLRHGGTKKWFGIIMQAPSKYFGGGEVLTLKCPVDLSPFLFEKFGGIHPAYHMNKIHWISVFTGSDIPKEEVFKLVGLSYDITKELK